MTHHRTTVVPRLLGLAIWLLSVGTLAMPPSRMGPSWANHNRMARNGQHATVLRTSPHDGVVPVVSKRSSVAPMPERAKLLNEISKPPAPDRLRVVVDLESKAPAVYLSDSASLRAIPVEMTGAAKGKRGASNEALARAAYNDAKTNLGSGPPERILFDPDTGDIWIVRDGEQRRATPARTTIIQDPVTEYDVEPPRHASR